jgi:glyoxylase-like metal-dependent hydrolase (beta-lactamase superfamily II)
MKLYILYGGQAHIPDMSQLTPGRNVGKPVTFPFPMYLIDHPKGLVVFDTGFYLDKDTDSYINQPGHPDWKPELRIDRQLTKLGYKSEDVKFVILSHLHTDHCGGMALFPHATFIVRKQELYSAWWPESSQTGYSFDDFKDTRDFKYIQPLDDEELDVFYDGSLVCFDTRGHTRGHQSLIVNLPEYGKIVLAVDAIPMRENLEEKIVPGICWNTEMAIRAIEKLQHMQSAGMHIIAGHDPVAWKTLKTAPDFYE